MRQNLPDSLRDEIGGIAGSVGCELFQIEIKGSTLRIVLDCEDGPVTHDHCSTVSRQVSALLDVEDFSTAKYVLEVSSPGLDRPLLASRDWKRFTGRLAKVTFTRPKSDDDSTPVKRTVVGRIDAFSPNSNNPHLGIVHLEVASPQESLELRLEDISRAKLEVEL